MNEENHVIHKDGQVSTDKVDNAIEKIAPEEREQILQNFDAFKEYLGKRIAMGESIGLSEEQMAKIAEKVADYLAAGRNPVIVKKNCFRSCGMLARKMNATCWLICSFVWHKAPHPIIKISVYA